MSADRHRRLAETLEHPVRRTVILELADRPASGDGREVNGTSLQTLAAGSGTDVAAVELTGEHLPVLERYGYAERDLKTGRIERGPNWVGVEPALRLLRTTGDPSDWDCTTCGDEDVIGQFTLRLDSDGDLREIDVAFCEPCLAEFRADEKTELL